MAVAIQALDPAPYANHRHIKVGSLDCSQSPTLCTGLMLRAQTHHQLPSSKDHTRNVLRPMIDECLNNHAQATSKPWVKDVVRRAHQGGGGPLGGAGVWMRQHGARLQRCAAAAAFHSKTGPSSDPADCCHHCLSWLAVAAAAAAVGCGDQEV